MGCRSRQSAVRHRFPHRSLLRVPQPQSRQDDQRRLLGVSLV
ncbi:Uncharacterised protein [Vibrio cholerae]|nr:Uncharacterised protein [Vibrio cholerae]CSI49664.1 Uncharacterised protein [Vibrio cholerae]